MTTRRTTSRVAAGGLLTALALGGSTLTAAPAHAGFKQVLNIHEARVQLCKVPRAGDAFDVRLRLNNKGADHAHRGVLSRERRGKWTTISVQAAGGKLSGAKSLRWKKGDTLSVGMAEVKGGGGAGGGIGIRQVPAC